MRNGTVAHIIRDVIDDVIDDVLDDVLKNVRTTFSTTFSVTSFWRPSCGRRLFFVVLCGRPASISFWLGFAFQFPFFMTDLLLSRSRALSVAPYPLLPDLLSASLWFLVVSCFIVLCVAFRAAASISFLTIDLSGNRLPIPFAGLVRVGFLNFGL